MYKNARLPPRGGFRPSGVPGEIDDGPSEKQRAAKARYEETIARQRAGSRAANHPNIIAAKRIGQPGTRYTATGELDRSERSGNAAGLALEIGAGSSHEGVA